MKPQYLWFWNVMPKTYTNFLQWRLKSVEITKHWGSNSFGATYIMVHFFKFKYLKIAYFTIEPFSPKVTTKKVSKNEDFFTFYKFIQNLTLMLLGQLHLGNNLPTHIRENTDFLQQKPRQWLSAEANFEGCYENVSDNKMKQKFPGDKFNLHSKLAPWNSDGDFLYEERT